MRSLYRVASFCKQRLVLAADNEAELAGVMAHEIAHVAARHAMENERKMQIWIMDCSQEFFSAAA